MQSKLQVLAIGYSFIYLFLNVYFHPFSCFSILKPQKRSRHLFFKCKQLKVHFRINQAPKRKWKPQKLLTNLRKTNIKPKGMEFSRVAFKPGDIHFTRGAFPTSVFFHLKLFLKPLKLFFQLKFILFKWMNQFFLLYFLYFVLWTVNCSIFVTLPIKSVNIEDVKVFKNRLSDGKHYLINFFILLNNQVS